MTQLKIMKMARLRTAKTILLTMIATGTLSGCGLIFFADSDDKDESRSYAQDETISESSGTNAVSVSENKGLENFDSIVLAGPDDVEIIIGDSYSWSAKGNIEALANLRVERSDKILKIYRKKASGIDWDKSPSVKVSVTLPVINNFTLAGSGDAEIRNMNGKPANIIIAGSGDVNVRGFGANSADITIAGSGDAKLKGAIQSLNVNIVGSGNIKASDLSADTSNIRIAGSGDVKLSSNGTVEAVIVGSGNIDIDGNAKCTSRKIGSGDISCG